MSIKGRTVWQFATTEDIWSKVEAWAEETVYELIEKEESSRLYRRGSGWLVASRMLKVTASPSVYTIEAWVQLSGIARVIGLGLLPGEMVIDSGGYRMFVPRSRTREDVNKLLASVGVQPYIT